MSYIMSTFLKFCFVLLKKISFLGQVLLRIEDIGITNLCNAYLKNFQSHFPSQDLNYSCLRQF